MPRLIHGSPFAAILDIASVVIEVSLDSRCSVTIRNVDLGASLEPMVIEIVDAETLPLLRSREKAEREAGQTKTRVT
jgi:hypothetical protein